MPTRIAEPASVIEHKPGTISTRDLICATTLVTRVFTAATSYEERLHLVMSEFLTLFSAKLVTAAIIRPTRDTPTGLPSVEVSEGSHLGELTQEERDAMLRYFADIHRDPDPAHTAMCETLLAMHKAGRIEPLAKSHESLVGKNAPRWNEHCANVRTPGNVGAEMFIAVPTQEPGLWGGLTLHRASQQPYFTLRDEALALAFAHSLQPMFDAHIKHRTAQRIVASLTPRLRETLAGILAGGSEKTIASSMDLSRHTIHEHMKRLHRAFSVSTRTELLAAVHRLGITLDMVLPASDTPPPLLMGKRAKVALGKKPANSRRKSK